MTLQLQPLQPQQQDEAVRVLARAFVTNPLHEAAFGPGRLAPNEAFFRVGLAAMAWVSAWARCDPAGPHLHLGPIGVDPSAQGRHVGHLLMERYCAELERTGALGYLETDRRTNVAFYERFGFRLAGARSVLGVENFFMRREPRGPAASGRPA